MNTSKIGAMNQIMSKHVMSKEIKSEIDRFPSMTILGLGQGGGRIAAEFSRFEFPTFLVNSSKSDMDEHKLIPDDRKILTKSAEYPELEGTDKNAQLGYQIAAENRETYKKLLVKDEFQNADFVWVTVSLGGGTGNGALKVALTFLKQIRKRRELPGGRIPLGVICSLPSKDEKGSSFRQNALAGIKVLQEMVENEEIGSVLVIDNEKIKDYYAESPVKTYANNIIDAKSYSNMVVATLVVELSTMPLLSGRSVFDRTEYLSTISTPGWLSISKMDDVNSIDNDLEKIIGQLFTQNEVLAENTIDNVATGAVAVLYPEAKKVSSKDVDDVFRYTSELLDTKINNAISANSAIDSLILYGVTVSNSLPKRVKELSAELKEWKEREQEQLRKRKESAANDIGLSEFDDFFSASAKTSRQQQASINIDELDDELDNKKRSKSYSLTMDDLDDLDF